MMISPVAHAVVHAGAPPARLAAKTSGELPLLMTDARIVPFDQVVTFDLTGQRDRILTQVLNISIEGHFVAVAINASVLPEPPIDFGPVLNRGNDEFSPDDAPFESITLAELFAGLVRAVQEQKRGLSATQIELLLLRLARGSVRLNPAVANRLFSQSGWRGTLLSSLGEDANRLFQAFTCETDEVSFLYTIADNATGREFQSEAIHHLAGLGALDGDRPFRFFPEPILFTPRTVIRVQITEFSGRGRLYLVLQGYKVLDTERQRRE
jgi:hypothetical protein